MKNIALLIISILCLTACQSKFDESGLIRVELTPGESSDEIRGLRWSPKGEKIALTEEGKAMVGSLILGPEDLAGIGVKLFKTNDEPQFNSLALDLDRNGRFNDAADTTLTCTVSTSRGKFWSSFSSDVTIPFQKNAFHNKFELPYPLSFWYVEDPTEPQQEKVLRFSRRGWLEGTADSEFGPIRVLLTESKMDGVFDRDDSWAISLEPDRKDLFQSKNARSGDTHNWLGEQAFGIDSILPSGRFVWIKPVDPQITRAEEEKQKDYLAPDRAAARSGKKVNFLHDYKAALALAEKGNKALFIDFETDWCGPCKTMDQWVYTADKIVAASENWVCVKIDGDKQKDLVKKYKVSGYPTLIVIKNEQELARASGYQSVSKTLALLGK